MCDKSPPAISGVFRPETAVHPAARNRSHRRSTPSTDGRNAGAVATTASPPAPPAPVSQHRPVGLLQHVTSHLRHPVGSHPHDVGVVGGMVDLAEGQPVGDLMGPALGIGDDVGGIQQLPMP